MEHDKEYFRKRLKESQKQYDQSNESSRIKKQNTAQLMADKVKSENLVSLVPGCEFLFFYGSNSVFSQWFKCEFQVEGTEFTCAEQYMMYKKALLFSDRKAANAIIEAGYDPMKHKKIGRTILGFTAEVWDQEKKDIVYEGNFQKFTQNLGLKRDLMDTYPKILVEASPSDPIWGIGLSISDPRKLNPDNWKGQNLLGFILTRLRENLQKSQNIIER